jgi:hypothetical protein
LLLLGESHYAEACYDTPSLTREVIERVRTGVETARLFTRVCRLVDGIGPLDDARRRRFWDGVAFYNFVPELVGTGARQRPTAAMWARGPAALALVLDALQPTHVLALGQTLWNHVTLPSGWCSREMADGSAIRSWEPPGGRPVFATWVNHPSSNGFAVAKWRDRVEDLLRLRHD